MIKVEYLSKAKDDLTEIHFYISEDSVSAADKMINKILDKVELLGEFPEMGVQVSKLGSMKGYRMIPIKPYLVFYKLIGDVVYIYRVLHEKRYYKALLD